VTTFRSFIFSTMVLLLTGVAVAQGTYTQIDFPNAGSTYCMGVDSSGDISGFYEDTSSSFQGFIFSKGSFTSVSFPGAVSTFLGGLNDVGQVAGSSWISDNFAYHSFVYNFQDQTFIRLKTPEGQLTFSNAINDDGTVVGYTLLVDRTVAFEYSLYSERFKQILPVNVAFAEAFGITDRGQIVGRVVLHNGQFSDSVVFEGGQYRILNIPGVQAAVSGINPAGTAYVGGYGQPNGFVYANKVLTTLEFPGAVETFASGVNNAGQVVGSFTDAAGLTHGFLYSPSSEATGN